jgi:hypothetical protein
MKHVHAKRGRPAAVVVDGDTVAAAVMAVADAEIAAIVAVIKRKVKGNFTQSARFGVRFFLPKNAIANAHKTLALVPINLTG